MNNLKDNDELLKIIEISKESGLNIKDIFSILSKRREFLKNQYKKTLNSNWEMGFLSPKDYERIKDVLNDIDNKYDDFVNMVINHNILKLFNSKNKSINSVEDWADAIETLWGFENFYRQALYRKDQKLSKNELNQLKKYCLQSQSCKSPCSLKKIGLIRKKTQCTI